MPPLPGASSRSTSAWASSPRCSTRIRTGRGWLATVRPDGREYRDFPTGEQAQSWIRREDYRLNAFLENELAIAAADGGEWIVAPTTMLTTDQFEALAREFLVSE